MILSKHDAVLRSDYERWRDGTDQPRKSANLQHRKTPAQIAAALRRAKRLARELAAQFSEHGRSIEANRLESAVQTGNIWLIEQVLDFARMARDLTATVRPAFHDEFMEGAQVSNRQLQQAQIAIRFNAMDPRATQWAARHSGNLITEITTGQKQLVQDIVSAAQREGNTVKEVARDLKVFIGLRSDQHAALEKYRASLVEDGLPPTEVARLADKYHGQLLRDRTEMIARHELLTATHEGQLQAVREGINQGLIDPSRTKRVWIVADDERLCEICRPMDGQTVDADEPFILVSDGDQPIWIPQEAHPQCRCDFSLTTTQGEE